MDTPVTGILYNPWPDQPGTGIKGLYRRQLAHKANPRTEDYMRERFQEAFPEGRLIRFTDPGARDAIRNASQLALLYPDATGIGFEPVESLAMQAKTFPIVLTGRRRRFVLDFDTLKRLRRLRFLERNLAGELIWGVCLLIASVFWLATDLIRGRR